jgi:hypothetical protein
LSNYRELELDVGPLTLGRKLGGLFLRR